MTGKHTPGYEVTCQGEVYSTDHNWRGYGRRLLSQDLNSHGYPSVRVTVYGKRTRLLVHWLVAKKYLGKKPSGLHQIRHLNGNREDNRVSNLAWGTAKQNADDRKLHGMTSHGKPHSEAILRGLSAKAEGCE